MQQVNVQKRNTGMERHTLIYVMTNWLVVQ